MRHLWEVRSLKEVFFRFVLSVKSVLDSESKFREAYVFKLNNEWHEKNKLRKNSI